MDLIPKGSTVLAGGIGYNISFDTEMISKKDCLVVAIDPSELSARLMRSRTHEPNLLYLKKAFWPTDEEELDFYEGNSGNGLMGSTENEHWSISQSQYGVANHKCKAISLGTLCKSFSDVSYLKLDIEGGEYAILDSLESLDIPQVSIEFHHFCSDKWSREETHACVKKMNEWGYTEYPYDREEDPVEWLFIKEGV